MSDIVERRAEAGASALGRAIRETNDAQRQWITQELKKGLPVIRPFSIGFLSTRTFYGIIMPDGYPLMCRKKGATGYYQDEWVTTRKDVARRRLQKEIARMTPSVNQGESDQ